MPDRAEYLMGIDLGTQSLRTGIFDLEGRPVVFSTQEYPVYHPYPGWAEQEATDWWEAVKFTVQECLAKSSLSASQIIGLSYDATSCTMLPVDEKGNPLRRALIWMDIRAVEEAEFVSRTGHPILKYVGDKDSPEWMIPKALWIKRHEPEIYLRAHKIIEATDYLTYKLTGCWTACMNNITCKWNYARPEGGWRRDFLQQIGLEDILEKWPSTIYYLGERVGTLQALAAKELGLSPQTVVAQGGIDAYTGIIGLNVVHPGRLALVLGSSTVHLALSSQPVYNTGVWGPYPDAVLPGLWALEGGQVSTGSIVKWFADNFAYQEFQEAERKGLSVYQLLDEKVSRIPPGSEGLVVLDYWQGNRTPYRDPLARGVIWGLTLKHGVGHLMRAIYEGTAYGTRHILDSMAGGGFKVEEVYACGGGARSHQWLQIHADVCNLPISLTEVAEAPTLGSAICAAVGAKRYPDLVTASEKMVKVSHRIEPDPGHHEIYQFYYHKYLDTYPRLKDLMQDVARKLGS